MPQYVPLNIPPGFRHHGVDLESSFRWLNGSLVRWEQGSLRPVGGWRPLKVLVGGSPTPVTITAGSEQLAPRALHAWIDNQSEPYLAIGSNNKLYGTGPSLAPADITPASFTPGVIGENLSYGGKDYNLDVYGVERTSDGTSVPLAVWSLDNFGEKLVCCTSQDKTLYLWELDDATPTLAAPITKSGGSTDDPPTAEYLIVTAERFLFALAANDNPRLVYWCDREDFTQWDITTTTEAGFYELQTSGRILGAAKVRGRTLILTSTDAHVAIYNGPPTVYGFQRVGVNCGLAAPKVVVHAQFGAFWMGDNGFYSFDGSTVQEIPCPVQDFVFNDLNKQEIRKAFAVSNERHQEIWWFYPSLSAVECDRYVAYDYAEGIWLIGELDRTCGVDLSVYNDPIWLDYDGNFYRHEVGYLHDGQDIFAETGPLFIGNGDNVIHATKLLQDEDTAQECTVSFSTRFSPDGTEWNHGPYTLGNDTSVRFTGRQARMKVIGEDNVSWRIGGFRLEYETGGRR